MLFSTTKSTNSRRTLARVAVAGAIVAVPLTALAIPASADAQIGVPGVTDVRQHHPRHDPNCDFGPFKNWRCNNGPFSDRGHEQDPFWQFRQNRPHGLFGSS